MTRLLVVWTSSCTHRCGADLLLVECMASRGLGTGLAALSPARVGVPAIRTGQRDSTRRSAGHSWRAARSCSSSAAQNLCHRAGGDRMHALSCVCLWCIVPIARFACVCVPGRIRLHKQRDRIRARCMDGDGGTRTRSECVCVLRDGQASG